MQHALLWYCGNIGDLRALLLAVGIYGAEFLFDAALFISRRRRCRIEGEEAYRSLPREQILDDVPTYYCQQLYSLKSAHRYHLRDGLPSH